jgi:flagellar biosynthesis/type III secretory pathway chaperone
MSSLTSSLLEALYQTLSNEVDGYRQLVTLTQSERVVLQTGNLSELMAKIQGKESLLSRLAQWEQARRRIMTSLAERLALPVASLSDLLVYCDETIGPKLSTLRQELITLVEQLRSLDQNNQLLLQAELVRVNVTLKFLLSDLAPDGQYVANGASLAPRLPVTGNVRNWQI